MKHFIILAFAAITFSSCKDFFAQTVEIDPPAYDVSLVFHETLSNEDSVVRVTLTRNYGILDNVDYSQWFVRGATVEWWKNGVKIMDLLPLSADSNFVYTAPLSQKLQPGDTYEIRVSHPDFEPVRAVQTMPEPLSAFTNAILSRGVTTNQFGERLSELEVSFADAAGVADFYEINMYGRYQYVQFTGFEPDGTPIYDTIQYLNRVYFETTFDPNIQKGLGESVLISDQLFDGKEYKFKGQFYDYNENDSTTVFYLDIRHTTPEYFNWSRSYQARADNADNPFAEPVNVFNNLENGLGIFGLFAEKKVEFQ